MKWLPANPSFKRWLVTVFIMKGCLGNQANISNENELMCDISVKKILGRTQIF